MDDTGAPKLDARSHDDIIVQTEALAIAYTSGLVPGPWRPRSNGTLDFGGVLVRLFGGMVDHLIAQLNRAPDKHRAAFTALLGARRTPPRPARVPVSFTLADRGGLTEVPAGAQVAAAGADGPVVFETELALPLTQARLAAAVVRDVSGAGGYAIRTDIATGKLAGSFAALGDGQPIEHFLYVAVDELTALAGANTLTLTVDGQGAALPATRVTWASALPSGDWSPLPPVTATATRWTEAAPVSAIGATLVGGVTARWLRATVPAGTPPTAITAAVGFKVTTATPVDAAYANGQRLDFTRDVQPFGSRPQFNDTFFLASDAAFAVAGTTVAINFTFTPPPGGVNTADSPTLRWEAWDGKHATSLGTTTVSGTGIGAVTGGLTDSTKAFSQDGVVSFTLPAAIPRSTIGTVTSRWVRVRLIAGDYGQDFQVPTTPGGVITPPTFRPPSITSMTLTWQGTTPTRPPSLVVRQTAQTYDFFRGADAAGPLPIFLAAPELAFQAAIETRSSLQLGFDRAFEPVLTTLYLQVFPPASPDPALFGAAPTPRNPPHLVWEYWNGRAWLAFDVEDGTLNLSRSGLVRFEPPADAASLTQFGRTLFWLRARSLDPTFSPMPRVGRVMVNTVWASNARTTTREVIGSSSGARDQQFTLAQKPVLDGQRIEVGEPEPSPPAELAALQADEGDDVLTPDAVAGVTWVRWHEVPDFYASGSRDRHYTFDAATGTVTFGDGAAGMIPPAGVQNVRAAIYRAGGGTAGNVAAGAVNQLQTTVALVDSVTNTEPAVGGAPIEPVPALLDRATRQVRHGGRAVTAQDFSDLALESSREIARAVAITPSFSPISQANGPLTGPADLGRDGQVVVVIVPAEVQPGASPSSDLCAEVEDYLRARCAPDARVMVIGPSWVATDVVIHVTATSLERTDDVVAAVRAAVVGLLDPMTGGDLGTGWDFGRCPRASDFVAQLAAIPDIDHVSSITVTCDPAFKDTDPQAELLVDELSLYPRLLAYARTLTVTAQPLGVPVIELPVLDDRTYADFAGAARALIPSLTPDWTDHNPSDPGIVLVELLAWLAEIVLYRIDRVPERSYRTFLALLRGPSAPSLDDRPLDAAIRDTVADLRARRRAITPDDFEFLALHRWPTLSAAQALGALGTVRRALCIPEHSPTTLATRWKPGAPLAPGHVTVIVVPDALAAGRADLASFDPGRKFALELDGTAAYVDCDNDPSLALTGPLTLSAWIFPRNLARGRQGVVSKSASGEYELVLEPSGALTFTQASGHDGGSSAAGAVTAGRWSHVAAVRASGGGSVTLFVDGHAVQTLPLATAPGQIPTTTSPVLIGRLAAGGGFFDGFVRDVAIWSQQRTATDLGGDLQRVPPGIDDVPPGAPTPRPVACWRLDTQLAATVAVPDCETPAAAAGAQRKRDGTQHGSAFRDVVHPMPAVDGLLGGLRALYDEWRLLTTRVDVIGSTPLHVAVTAANLYLRPDADVPGIRAAASAALGRFLDPLTGLHGDGWPLGRTIYSFDLAAALDALPGVDFVTGVQIEITDPAQIAAVAAGTRPPPPHDDSGAPIGVSLQPDELPSFDGAKFSLFQRVGGTRWQPQPQL